MQKLILLSFLMLITNVQSQFVDVFSSEPNDENNWLKKNSIMLFLPESFLNAQKPAQFTIQMDQNKKCQQMDGFGTAFTEISAWLLKYMLSPSKSNEVFEKLFTPAGINLSLLRHSIGSSDFSWESWTLGDTIKNEDDFELKQFSLWRESSYIQPILNKITQTTSKRLKIIATLFSPPAWMKSKKNLIGSLGGSLRPECYESFARYIVKYLMECERRNGPIYALSIQNQPWSAPSDFSGMSIKIEEQVKLFNSINVKLGASNLKAKLLIFDDSFDKAKIQLAKNLIQSSKIISGTALHATDEANYSVLTQFRNEFPNKEIWITKLDISAKCATLKFINEMIHLIRAPRNWAKGVVLGTLALDSYGGPSLTSINQSFISQGLITVPLTSQISDSVKFGTGYYSLGHSSKFVEPGAFRLETNTFENEIENVAYLNPDQSLVVVIVNLKLVDQVVKLKWNSKAVLVNLPKLSAATVKWSSLNLALFKKNVFIVSKANEQFVSLRNEAKMAGVLVANKVDKKGAEVFEISSEKANLVTIKALSSRKFVRVENDGVLVADREKANEAELFEIVFFSDASFGLKSKKLQRYVCADNFGTMPLAASRVSVDQSWDDFLTVDAN